MRNEEEEWSEGIYLRAIFVRFFSMSVSSGLIYFEQHFLYSNKFLQYIMGVRPHQSSNHLLFQVCTVNVYVLPVIAHQVIIFVFNVYLIMPIKIILINVIALRIFFFI